MSEQEHVAQPAVSRVKCWCGEVVEMQVPVLVTLDGNRVWAYVDQETGYGQELWDHALVEHGPVLDEVGDEDE